ncbi:hypothetical protein [Lysobacter sp. D1-1-M9]|uniref:hypothetical protein n=1 Tax=Novilysobacter longmucuonensis TaxID=3098603 RepID=UPI002FCA1D3D
MAAISGRPKAGSNELSVLKRENARLQEENEILEKATAYFAWQLPGSTHGSVRRPGNW